MITESEIENVLRETNPGLTKQELSELGSAMYSLVAENCPSGITLPSGMIEECLNAVQELRMFYDSVENPNVEEVVKHNEFKNLEWKLQEELRNV